MILWYVASFLAYFVKGVTGFANTLIFTSIMAFFTKGANITPIELLLGLPSNAIMIYRERKSIRPKVALPMILMMMAGCIPGVLLLKSAGDAVVKVVFGVIIVGLGIEMLLRDKAKQAKQSKVLTACIGVLSGLLCGLYGVGALLSAYMARVSKDSHDFKANMCLVFICENIFRVILYTASGLLTLSVLKQTLLLSPAMLLGLLGGMKLAGHIKESIARKLVAVALIVSGISLALTVLLA